MIQTAFILANTIGGDGDIKVEELPTWQIALPYICLAYTVIVLYAASIKRMVQYKQGSTRMMWLTIIILLPLIGALIALALFKPRPAL